MTANLDHKTDFENLIYNLKEDYPNLSESEIKNILEERLLELFKEYIIEMKIPQDIAIKDLRYLKGRIKLMQKSSRWDKKIDSIINQYNRNRYFLKLKGIQDDLKIWDKFSYNNSLSSVVNGSSLKYFDGTYYEFNGNKNVDTKLESKEMRKNQSQVDYGKSLINDGGYETIKYDLKTDFGFYEDSFKFLEESYKYKEDEIDRKILIDQDLLEKIKSFKIKPIIKKETQNLSIEALMEELDKLDDN